MGIKVRCQEYSQPLEEWEAGLCEGCGSMAVYSFSEQTERRALAVAAYMTRNRVPAKVRFDERISVWKVDHDKRISQSLQLMICAFRAGLDWADFDTERRQELQVMTKRKEKVKCSECGDTIKLLEHPNYSGDRLCRDCLIVFHEVTIEELESEIQLHRQDIEKIKKGR